MTIRPYLAGLLVSIGVSLAPGHAVAGAQPLVVFADQSQVVKLPRPAGTVVIGNPSLADASIQGQILFLHGRSFGTTNLIVLDEQGSQIADYELIVQMGGSNNVTVFKAALEYSYVCAPDCEGQMHVGDDPDFFKKWIYENSKNKITLATGQKPTEVNQPSPPQ